jgi:hypothetical protein
MTKKYADRFLILCLFFETEFPAQAAEFFLFGGSQATHFLDDGRYVDREQFLNKISPFFG